MLCGVPLGWHDACFGMGNSVLTHLRLHPSLFSPPPPPQCSWMYQTLGKQSSGHTKPSKYGVCLSKHCPIPYPPPPPPGQWGEVLLLLSLHRAGTEDSRGS